MPLNWTGALRTVVAPTADVPVHRPGYQLHVLPVPPLCPAADPPLTFLLGGTAALRPEQRQHHPGQQHRRRHHGGDFPARIPVREPIPTGTAACGTDPGAAPLRRDPADGGSRKLRSCRSLCHAPDPPGGDGRRKRGGGGSSSRAAPAPARGGEAAGADLGEGAGSSGAEACAKRGNIWLWQGREAGGGWSRSCSNFTWGARSSKACSRGGLLQHSRGTPGNGSAEEETWVKQTCRRRGLTFWPASVSAALRLVDTKSKTDRDYAELWKLEALIKYLLPPSSHLSFHLIYFLGKHKICCGLASYTNCFSLAIYMSLSLTFISSSLSWVFLL